MISKLHIGDHSFQNARIPPISGPLRKEDEAITVEDIAEGESLTEEQAIQRFKCPFTHLTEISIGEVPRLEYIADVNGKRLPSLHFPSLINFLYRGRNGLWW